MTLTDAQIDRYSRQIIVPQIGGRGQERLLAARILLAGDTRDLEAPLAYLVGAGVGTIAIRLAGDRGRFAERITAMRELNAGVSVTLAGLASTQADLALAIVGSDAAGKLADQIANDRAVHALVIARLDAPGQIAVIPDPHTAGAVDHATLAAVGVRAEAADFIAMLATAEALKLIAGYAESPSRAIIEFDGYQSRARVNP